MLPLKLGPGLDAGPSFLKESTVPSVNELSASPVVQR